MYSHTLRLPPPTPLQPLMVELRAALEMAGVSPRNIAGITLEPTSIVVALTAASNKILLELNKPTYILVCDIGGGTSDFTICCVENEAETHASHDGTRSR